MSNQEKIEQLEAYKFRERFILDDWEDRELVPSSNSTIERMHKEVERFTDFLINQLAANVSNLQTQVQLYFNGWDNEYFSQDETEYIVEIEYEAMRIAGINIDKLMI
ncbi:hypothetical protein [Emticicia sp. SJ17W-69]|uniref:hypothetical protein n=1 Tax=Emticicia sp. SJ17W-69 TaxID=3421657 RepID=UPI003EB7A99D